MEERRNFMKFGVNNFIKNCLFGSALGLAANFVSSKRRPAVFIFSYFIGKSLGETKSYYKSMVKNI